MDYEHKKLKILDLKKRVQSIAESERIVKTIVDTLKHIGYQRVRYYNIISDSNLREVLIVGRYSRGMNKAKGFYGFCFHERDKDYLRELMHSKEPILWTGKETLLRNRRRQWEKELDLRNEQFIDVPLVIGDDLFGLISVDNKGQKDSLTKHDVSLLNDLASFASVAIQNARSLENILILNEIGAEAMKRQLDKGLLRFIVKTICRRLNAGMSSIFLYDEHEDKLIRRETYIDGCSDGQLKKLFEEKYSPGENLTGYAYKYGKAINAFELSDFEKGSGIKVNWKNVEKYQNFTFKATGKKIAIRNAILAPLIVQNKKIGVIRVANNLGGKVPFPNCDINLLEILANQIALIIHNAISFQSSENLSKRLAMLSEANDEMLSALQRDCTPRERLDLIVKYASKIMEAENTALFLVKKKKTKRFLHLMTEHGNPFRDPAEKIELEIRSGSRTGLTGHAAKYGRPIRLFDRKRINHWAVRQQKSTRSHLKSEKCISFLATPLRRKNDLIGLLKSENKYRTEDSRRQLIPFSEEDVTLSQIFANKMVLCLDLVERQKFLDSLVQEIAEPFVAVDRNGNVQKFNQMAEKLLGWKEREILGKPVVRLHKDKASAKSLMEKLRKSKGRKVRDVRILCKHKNGELIPISLSAALLLDETGERIGSIGVFRDMRELKRREEEERMATFGTITAGIAHEIRSVLQTIKIQAERASKSSKGGRTTTEEMLRFSRKVQEQIVEGHKILDWREFLRSSHELERTRVNLSKMISLALNKLSNKLAAREIMVRRRISSSVFVLADQMAISLIFRNILANAINSMKKRGVIEVRAKQSKREVEVHFRDSGRGIPKRNVAKIFNPFFTTIRRKRSMGLGLFFSKYLAQRMGGDVYLEETSQQGSTFVVKLKKANQKR